MLKFWKGTKRRPLDTPPEWLIKQSARPGDKVRITVKISTDHHWPNGNVTPSYGQAIMHYGVDMVNGEISMTNNRGEVVSKLVDGAEYTLIRKTDA